MSAAAILLLSQLEAVTVAEKVPPKKQEPRCIEAKEVPHFYANAKKKERPFSFGPKASGRSTHAANAELKYRLCGRGKRGGDRRLYAALRSAVDGSNPNRSISHKRWEDGVEKFMDGLQWHRARIVTLSYWDRQSLYMKPHGHRDPLVGSSSVSTTDDKFLVIPVDGGGKLVLRLKCGFQPVFRSRSQLPKGLL